MSRVSAEGISALVKLVEENPDYFAHPAKGCDPVELAYLKLHELIQADFLNRMGMAEVIERAECERTPLASEAEQ